MTSPTAHDRFGVRTEPASPIAWRAQQECGTFSTQQGVPVAEPIADLWWLMLGLGVVVFLAFAVLLAVGLWSPPSTDEASARTRVVRWIGWGGVIMPLLVIVVVFAATVYAMRVLPIAAPRDALAIEVVGHQFWYEVHYPESVRPTVTSSLPRPRLLAAPRYRVLQRQRVVAGAGRGAVRQGDVAPWLSRRRRVSRR